jgi:hypothetical protein
VRRFEPSGKLLNKHVAVPVPEFTGTLAQMGTTPRLKVTVPAGVPTALDTAAVNVTLDPYGAGLSELLRLVAVEIGFTVYETALDVDPASSTDELE